ncbi:hypothetical protein B0H13DRAFT_1613390 [Mycena leptocephala]|nr:hypothetical protein B0H13DRAFT_1613390 [Mycena leptocephala]
MTRNPTAKLILVIGATGGQGQAVVDALLAPASDGSVSSYTVRALTRDLGSAQALALTARGVECVQGSMTLNKPGTGSFTDFGAVARALDGVYGVWVNNDGPSVGEDQEIYGGMRIFELAKRTPSLRHYVWSSLPYILKVPGFNPDYKSDQADAKGRVAEWLSMQLSVLAEDGLVWSVVTTTPYMDTLNDESGER